MQAAGAIMCEIALVFSKPKEKEMPPLNRKIFLPAAAF
jgi:hypothetical protein